MPGKTEPILTILVLTYDHEKTLSRALDSILEQLTDYSYQIVIAEDASTDKTQDICKAYAKKYPGTIMLRLQSQNTQGRHVTDALAEISTKYLTALEGDDYWCDRNKIQVALDFLEKHPAYTVFAHDTMYHSYLDDTDRSLVHDVLGLKQVESTMTFNNYFYLHTSGRVYRKCVDIKQVFGRKILAYDAYLAFLHLDKGPLHYHDKIMSVYNITGKGAWSKLSRDEQLAREDESNYTGNRLLGYRRDDFFSLRVHNPRRLMRIKKLFGVKLGWRLYYTCVKSELKLKKGKYASTKDGK